MDAIMLGQGKRPDTPRLRQLSTLLRLAATAGWNAGKCSAERGLRSSWNAADWDAAADAILAFLELNASAHPEDLVTGTSPDPFISPPEPGAGFGRAALACFRAG